jgi:hypothetical protein
MGHANPAFTLARYGRDPRDEQTMVPTCWHAPQPLVAD